MATRRGAYPGTFDPPTVAHLAVAAAARSQCELGHVELVVSEEPLGKLDDPNLTPVDARLELLERVAAAHEWLTVARTDAQLLADVAAGYDVVILGADKWAQVIDPSWYGSRPRARRRGRAAPARGAGTASAASVAPALRSADDPHDRHRSPRGVLDRGTRRASPVAGAGRRNDVSRADRRSVLFWSVLGLIAAGALWLRLDYIWTARDGKALGGDALYYHATANLVAEGRGFVNPFTYVFRGGLEQSAEHPPLYSLYLAAFSWLGFTSIHDHLVASALLGVATVVIGGLAGREIGGRKRWGCSPRCSSRCTRTCGATTAR